LAEHPVVHVGVFNIGGTQEVSIEQLAMQIISFTGSDSAIEFIPYDQAYSPGFEDMKRRVPDISSIEQLIGWTPSRTLDDILQSVIEHERGNQPDE
jgi:UDP-glucose 4-epimerase